MKDALVTVSYMNMRNVELRIPLHITPDELIRMLSEAFSLEHKSSKIQSEPLGRILDNTKTLAEEGVANGNLLTIL